MRNPTALLPQSQARFFPPPNDKLELTQTIGIMYRITFFTVNFFPFLLVLFPEFSISSLLAGPAGSHKIHSFRELISATNPTRWIPIRRVTRVRTRSLCFLSCVFFFFTFSLQSQNFLAISADVLKRVIDLGIGSRGMTRSSNKDSLIAEI